MLALRVTNCQLVGVNIPNLLTLSRIPIVFLIVGLLYLENTAGAATLALVVFLLGGLTDWLDGYFARRMGLVSNFGKLMDALTDKIFITGTFISLLALNHIPVSWGLPCLLLIISREFLITGLRLVAASSGIILAAEKSGKLKTVSQILALSLLLLKHALEKDFAKWTPEWLISGSGDLGLLFYLLATVLTVSSGSLYLAKYWKLFTGQNSE
jgi:CDP-diacylglycerol--glycerol-3-phosphate 3-phosphatidyltransferase